jgi:hypothetical protein
MGYKFYDMFDIKSVLQHVIHFMMDAKHVNQGSIILFFLLLPCASFWAA